MTLDLDIHELKAIRFAVQADLETVSENVEDFIGEDEPLLSALAKIDQVIGGK